MTSERCLVYRHVPFEDLGAFEPVLKGAGYNIEYFDVGSADFDLVAPVAADLLIVLGAPISANGVAQYPFLDDEIRNIRSRVVNDSPTVGICLGMQLIAAALGAEVKPAAEPEIGWGPIDLTRAGSESVLAPLAGMPVLHWHSDTAALPKGATLLAQTDLCANQAFAVGPNVLALQFHIENNPERIEQWLIGHAVELAKAGVKPNKIRADNARFGLDAALTGAMIFKRWLDALPGKAPALASTSHH
ncbi:MAG: glutamine amidotransferase [Alphaproteobacteria bacterium]